MSSFNKKLSIIIPVFNEKHTIQKILNKIYNLKNLKKELIVVNDASTDGTKEILNRNKNKITYLIHHKKNLGKGAAIQTAKKFIKGDVVIIQDADLEYDPGDYMKLLNFITKGYNVVYGSRVLGKNRYLSKNFSSVLRIFYNHMLTLLSNILNNQKLTDAHTCYKMFSSKIFLNIQLKEKDFSFCPEITTKIGLKNEKIREVPIKYNGRSYEEGKKINFIDGLKAILTLFKYRFFV
ncbi:glycosyltransferase family 2 protein [Candidatus Pelagibacter sp.]|nr:glycosyltransferase family 2 protein [Candidatus Pelagibacter sp.]